MAFSMKVYFNTLNPLLGLLSFGADQASRFVDLQKLVHERGGEDLSRLANIVPLEPAQVSQQRLAVRREQIKVFGTSECWRAKREQFAKLAAHATEAGTLSATETSLLLKQGQPFLLPRLYERRAAARGSEGVLIAGMPDCLIAGCGLGLDSSLLPGTAAERSIVSGGWRQGFVPGRAEIKEMAKSGLFRKFDDVSTTWKDPQHIGLKMFYRWQVSGSPPLPFAGVAARAFGTRAEENRAFRQPDFYRCRDNAPLGLVSGLQDTFKPNSQ